MINWIVSLVMEHRRAFITVITVIFVAAVYLSLRTPTRLEMDDFLPSDAGTENPYEEEIVNRFGASGRIVVYVESQTEIAVEEAARIIDELSDELLVADGVSSVRGRLEPEISRYFSELGPQRLFLYLTPAVLELVAERLARQYIEGALQPGRSSADPTLDLFKERRERDPLGLGMLAAQTLYEIAGSSPIQVEDGYFSLPGRKIFFLVVEPLPGADNLNQARKLVEGVDHVLNDYRERPENRSLLEGKNISAIGRPISYVAASNRVQDDARTVGVAATIAVFLLLALFFRSLLAPLVIVLPIVFGLAITGAVSFLFFDSVSLIAWVFVGVLIGLGVDFSLHIASHYFVHSEMESSRAAALKSSLERPGRGILISGLTTAAAFFSLAVLSYPVMKQVAILTGTGLLAMLLGSFSIGIIGLSFFEPTSKSSRAWWKWGSFLSILGTRRPAIGLFFWLAIFVAAGIASNSIPFEPHPWKLALRGNPKSAEMDRLNKEIGSSFSPILVVSVGETVEEAIERDRSAVKLMKRGVERARIVSIESISNWLPERSDQEANIRYVRDHPSIFSSARFRRDYDDVIKSIAEAGQAQAPATATEYLKTEYPATIERFLTGNQNAFDLQDLYDQDLGSELDKFIYPIVNRDPGEDTRQFAAISYVYLKQFPWAEGSINQFLETFKMFGGDELKGVTLIGDALRSARHSSVLKRDVLNASVLAFVLVFGILFSSFRSFFRVVLCLLPALCGIAASLIVMAFLQIELNLLTLGIAPLIIGIGVDDGIHIVDKLQRGRSLDGIFRETGSSMTMTTITTVAAFACLGFATYNGIQELGMVGAVGLITCLLASLHLVPICYRLSQ